MAHNGMMVSMDFEYCHYTVHTPIPVHSLDSTCHLSKLIYGCVIYGLK